MADEALRCLMHGLSSRAAGRARRGHARERAARGDRGCDRDSAARGAETRVEIIGARSRSRARLIGRAAVRVETVAKLIGVPGAVEIEMSDLAHGMDARIGAAGAVHELSRR